MLIAGFLLVLAILFGGVLLFITYPDAIFLKKMLVASGIFIFCVLTALVSLSIYESLVELVKLENQIEMFGEKEEQSNGKERSV
jgi:hypothetical protein